MKSNSVLIPLFVLIIMTAGCGGGGGVSSPPAQLVSINLSPLNPSIPKGMLEPFTLTGNYTDGTIKILTTSAVWTSSTSSVATINKATGVATSVEQGVTTITVSYGGFSPKSTTLTVTQTALVSIVVEPTNSSIAVGTTEQFTAMGTYTDSTTQNLTKSATWISSFPAIALVSNVTGSNGVVTSLTSGSTLISAKLGSVSGSTTLTVTGTSTPIANNVVPITVNGSLCSPSTSSFYFNKPCVSVKVCVPSTTICDTVDDILLDTGSFGLRVFKSALPNTFSSLAPITAGSGQLAECVTFGDGSTEWGPVQLADVVLGDETAPQVPIHVIDPTFGTAQNCGTPDQSPSAAGFNGILGVGVFGEDCGLTCQNAANNGLYYSCKGPVCTGTAVVLTNQVRNPVASLPPPYNNGVIVELPSTSLNGEPSANGSLVLGIGTQSNNMPPSGVVTYKTDEFGEIRTVFNGTNYNSIIDTGSNGIFFTSPSASMIPSCSQPNSEWFCPASITTLSAVNSDASGSTSGQVLFQIGNFTALSSTSGNNVFSDIGAALPNMFDWGLPFYLGKSVYVGIEGQASSLGTGHYFAY